MKQIELDLDPESTELTEQQTLPDDVLEALGVGRLTDIEYLGSGATSSVFSARDSSLDKKIAIKYLKHANENRLVNFQTEARLASQLSHHNLVRILNFGVTKKNHAFLIMEFVDGKSLEQILEEVGCIPIAIAIPLLMQVCDGLSHSHGKKIAHRDLKTANILVQGYGTDAMRAIIVDFGLAQQRQSQDETTPGIISGKIKGSPLFISPEQAQGRHGDERSDIYSLGCIAFNMLTGVLPFESAELFELLRMHIEQPAPAMSERAPTLTFPPGLESCIHRMLEKDPGNRFQTIQEVKAGLKRSQNVQPQASFQVSQVVPRRIRPGVAIACIAAIVATAAALYFVRPTTVNVSTVKHPNIATRGETYEEKFDRLFEYDSGDFLSHYQRPFVRPKESGHITDEDLECLDHVKLRTPDILLAFTHINGSGLAKLKDIPGLQLDLAKTELTEDGFKAIGSLQNLHGLSLTGAKLAVQTGNGRKLFEISNKEIAEVAKAKHLFELNLNVCEGLNVECMESIGSLPLKIFTAKDAKTITDDGITALAKNKEFRIIDLDGSEITDRSIEKLSEPGLLASFRANRCKRVTGKSIQTLCKKNPYLEYLGMSFTKTTSKDLHYLEGRDMRFLELLGIPLGPDEIRMIGNMHNMESMYLSKVQDPDSLKYLYSLKKAARIVFSDSSKLDGNSLSKLQNQLRNTTIIDGKNRAHRNDVEEFEGLFGESSSERNPFQNETRTVGISGI